MGGEQEERDSLLESVYSHVESFLHVFQSFVSLDYPIRPSLVSVGHASEYWLLR